MINIAIQWTFIVVYFLELCTKESDLLSSTKRMIPRINIKTVGKLFFKRLERKEVSYFFVEGNETNPFQISLISFEIQLLKDLFYLLFH